MSVFNRNTPTSMWRHHHNPHIHREVKLKESHIDSLEELQEFLLKAHQRAEKYTKMYREEYLTEPSNLSLRRHVWEEATSDTIRYIADVVSRAVSKKEREE